MRRIAQNVSWNRLVHELRSQTAQLQLLNTRLQSLTINASQTNNHLLTIAGQSQRNWEQLDYLNKCLGGFIGSVADSVEDEVVKAVENAQLSKQQYSFAAHSASTNRRRRSHEQQQQQQSKQWDMKFMLNYKRVDSKHGAKILYEIDGVGFACDPIDGDRVDHAIIVENMTMQ
jgi:hypothetical protein